MNVWDHPFEGYSRAVPSVLEGSIETAGWSVQGYVPLSLISWDTPTHILFPPPGPFHPDQNRARPPVGRQHLGSTPSFKAFFGYPIISIIQSTNVH